MLMDMVALRAINHRLGLTQAAGPPGKFGAFIENGEQGRQRLIMLWDHFTPGQWEPAVAGLSRTACELRAVGLPEPVWTTAKQYVLQDLEHAASARPNLEVARGLADALVAGRRPSPPDDLVRHARARLPAIGAGAMDRWWRRQWQAGIEHVRVESPELAGIADPGAAIGKAVEGARRSAGCKAGVRRSP